MEQNGALKSPQQELLSPAQSLAASLLGQGLPKAAVADQIGIGRTTIHRWLDDPTFCVAVERERDIAVQGLRDSTKVVASQTSTLCPRNKPARKPTPKDTIG